MTSTKVSETLILNVFAEGREKEKGEREGGGELQASGMD